jgi:hypothetical protein
MTDTRTEVHQAGRIAALWTGLLLAPCAFLVSLELGYLVVPASCARGTALPVHLVHAGCLLVALAGALVAWRSWRSEGSEWPGDAGGPGARSRFMAGVGLATSLLFGLTIVAQWIPALALHPCQ